MNISPHSHFHEFALRFSRNQTEGKRKIFIPQLKRQIQKRGKKNLFLLGETLRLRELTLRDWDEDEEKDLEREGERDREEERESEPE